MSSDNIFPNIIDEPIVEYWPVADKEVLLKHIEKIGRVCYKSEDRITDDSYKNFIKRLIDSRHEAMIEHFSITVAIKTDRGVANELVRHRLASFAQSSTRYVNYSKDKFGNNIEVIKPFYFDIDSPRISISFPVPIEPMNYIKVMANEFDIWLWSMMITNWTYITLVKTFNRQAQEARSVLPLCTATDIVITANPREWRHILLLRSVGTTGAPHPDMKKIMDKILILLYNEFPILFDDIYSKLHEVK